MQTDTIKFTTAEKKLIKSLRQLPLFGLKNFVSQLKDLDSSDNLDIISSLLSCFNNILEERKSENSTLSTHTHTNLQPKLHETKVNCCSENYQIIQKLIVRNLKSV